MALGWLQRAQHEWLKRARRGDLEGAWRVSDILCAASGPTTTRSVPRHYQRVWNRTDPRGRHVLVRCYHGLGDTIQFIRYVPLLEGVAKRVTVWAQPQLLPLISTVRGCDQWLPLHEGDAGVDYDLDVEVMELPYLFRSSLETIPRQVPYLHVSPMERQSTPTVGIVWRGGQWDSQRSIPFELLAPLLEIPSVRWVSLQQEQHPSECHPRLHYADVPTLLQTAQQMTTLDLVVSADTMAAHLAGALALPVWTLLPCNADWRWLEHRVDSPWYQTMRLFRQKVVNDWKSVITEVRDAITRESAPIGRGVEVSASTSTPRR
jgi:hypothetical protein